MSEKRARAIVEQAVIAQSIGMADVHPASVGEWLVKEIAKALREERRRVWEEAAKRLDEYNDDMARFDPGLQRIVEWMRQQAREEAR